MRCVEAVSTSLLVARQLEHAQIIFVNDQSTDLGVEHYLSGLAQSHPKMVTVLNTKNHTTQKNPNLALAVNMAMDRMRPQDLFYWNVETDVCPSPECLERLIFGMHQHQAGMTTPAFVNMERTQMMHFCPGIAPFDWQGTKPGTFGNQQTHWSHLGCNLIRREVVVDRRVRIPHEFRLWCADFALHWEIEDNTTYRVYAIADAVAYHAPHGSSRQQEGNVWAHHGLADEGTVNMDVRRHYNRWHL
jgi:hypothetical protein